jgi:hypothetical protein
MMKILKIILINLFVFLCLSTVADEARVVLLRGKAIYKPPGRKPFTLKKGLIIKKNGLLQTGKKSFLRLKFKDGSLINLGPSSTMTLSHEEQGKPKLVELLKGKIRGVINPKQTPPKGYNHKMIIKTRSASVGVRGTDFVVVYNEKNHITSNITLKGGVDLYKKPDEEIYESIREEFDEGGLRLNYDQGASLDAMEEDLNHYDSRKIPVGHFAGAFPSYEKSIEAVEISDHQLMALGGNKNLRLAEGERPQKVLQHNIKMGEMNNPNDSLVPQPRGEQNLKKDQYNKVKNTSGIRHGGHVDLNTGIYIAPPANAPQDPVTGKYLVPDELGGVHPDTGEYIPPRGVTLHPLNGFKFSNDVPKDRNVRENLEKLKNLSGPFNKQLSEALSIFKEVTRLDLHAFANYQYTTNVIENYFGEFRRVTNVPSMMWNLQGHTGFQLYHDKNWLIYPKANLTLRYFERALPQVKEQNMYTGMVGGEIHHKHEYFGRKARLIMDLQFTTRYMDWRRRNLFDFYYEDTSLMFKERFSFSRYNHFSAYYQIRAFQGYRDNDHGNIHNIGFNQELELGEIWSLLWGGEFSYRRDKIDSQKYQIAAGHLKFKWRDIMPKSDLTFGYTYQYHNTRFAGPFGDSRYYKADILFHRRLGQFWKLNLLYEFDRQRAKGVPFGGERRSFIRQTWGGGLTMVF